MDDSRFDSLTRRERDCLRLVDRETATGDIAARLGLSPASVDTYLKRAREKLGANSRYTAARGLRIFEARHQSEGPPRSGLFPSSGLPPERSAGQDEGEASTASTFAEQRPSFDHFAPIEEAWMAPVSRRSVNGMSPVGRVFVIVGLIVAIVLILILAFPLSESFQRLANLIDPINR